jgi:hypothetical protein
MPLKPLRPSSTDSTGVAIPNTKATDPPLLQSSLLDHMLALYDTLADPCNLARTLAYVEYAIHRGPDPRSDDAPGWGRGPQHAEQRCRGLVIALQLVAGGEIPCQKQ